jgi:hypothetical protein
MSRFIAPHHLAAAHLVLSALVLIWDLAIAGRIAKLRTTPAPMAFLSAVAGLMLLPALTVLLVSSSLLTGRTLATIEWVWVLTVALIAAQAIYAVAQRLVAPPIGVAIAAYDVLLAAVAAARYAVSVGWLVGTPVVALVAAERGALAFSAQRLALLMPWYLYLPIVAPASPGRRGPGTVLRTALAALAAAWGTLVLVDVPSAIRAVGSYRRYATVRLQERPDSDFTIGVKIFPTLSSAPPTLSIQSDLALADTVRAEALSIYLAPAGTTNATLDSIAHAIDESRGDKVLIVGLDLSHERRLSSAARTRFFDARLRDVERIARRLHPDYLVPVIDPNGAASRALGPLPASAWTTYLSDAARVTHTVSPAIRVMSHIGGFTRRDSALYTWSAAPSSPVDAIGLSFFPWLAGAETLDARLRTADDWLRASPPRKPHWVLETGAFPLSHGDLSQARAIWGTLAWATSRSVVKGAIIYEASDYEGPVGLRAAGGRMRLATATVRQAIAALAGN